jgi:ATP-binding cassette subfamily B protein
VLAQAQHRHVAHGSAKPELPTLPSCGRGTTASIYDILRPSEKDRSLRRLPVLFLRGFHLVWESAPRAVVVTAALQLAGSGRQDPGRLESLVVDGVSFGYPGTEGLALREVSLELRAGEVVALVGENGSGKTTLAKLLCGLYRPTEGSIRWNGRPLGELDRDALRRQIGVIFQDFLQYQLTAGANVAMGRHEAFEDHAAVVAAAELAGAHDFVSALPAGYDTLLTRAFLGGVELSIGEWQRVAVARAFFSDSSLLVLDEPTAALDPRGEHELFESVRALAKGRTVVLISHRFSTVKSADRIYVIDDGRIAASGTHDELMAAHGLYAELFTLQASAYLGAKSDGRGGNDPPVSF